MDQGDEMNLFVLSLLQHDVCMADVAILQTEVNTVVLFIMSSGWYVKAACCGNCRSTQESDSIAGSAWCSSDEGSVLLTFLSANTCSFTLKLLGLCPNTQVTQLEKKSCVTFNLFSAVELQICAYNLANFSLQNLKLVSGFPSCKMLWWQQQMSPQS